MDCFNRLALFCTIDSNQFHWCILPSVHMNTFSVENTVNIFLCFHLLSTRKWWKWCIIFLWKCELFRMLSTVGRFENAMLYFCVDGCNKTQTFDIVLVGMWSQSWVFKKKVLTEKMLFSFESWTYSL